MLHCILEFPRKLPRAKPCSDPNRVREPGEVEFDIEVGACPGSSHGTNMLYIEFLKYLQNKGLHARLGIFFTVEHLINMYKVLDSIPVLQNFKWLLCCDQPINGGL